MTVAVGVDFQGGLEYFLSFETKDRARLLGFLRLRFNSDPSSNIFPELKGAALIRELHVYGTRPAFS